VEFYFLSGNVIQLKAREASFITGWCIIFDIIRPVVNIENFVFACTLLGVAIFDCFTSYIKKEILMPSEYTGFLKNILGLGAFPIIIGIRGIIEFKESGFLRWIASLFK
jgi:hypothetical protein